MTVAACVTCISWKTSKQAKNTGPMQLLLAVSGVALLGTTRQIII
jgi:hypothetical protein